MRALITEAVHLLFSLPFYFLVVLVLLGLSHYRTGRDIHVHRWRHAYWVLIFVVYALSAPVVSTQIVSYLEGRYPVPVVLGQSKHGDNTIIVLSAGWLRSTPQGHDQKMGEAGWERTAAAVKLWRRVGGRLLFSGAPAPDGGSAAAKMAQHAREMGVPDQMLLVEAQSINTYENLLFSRRLLGERAGTLWLVTSALHMSRSVAVAKTLGLDVIPYPCDFRADQRLNWRMLIPANDGPAALEEAMHELIGNLVYRMRGWAQL